ncbi:MAG: hypothetical protein DMF89_20940 [Acidobacteria bacterium]|nr:MAG: hypothetical protein DMF89_20940 [Acidobacteriota bacterium]
MVRREFVLPVRLYIKALEQDGLGDRADLPNAFERGRLRPALFAFRRTPLDLRRVFRCPISGRNWRAGRAVRIFGVGGVWLAWGWCSPAGTL